MHYFQGSREHRPPPLGGASYLIVVYPDHTHIVLIFLSSVIELLDVRDLIFACGMIKFKCL